MPTREVIYVKHDKFIATIAPVIGGGYNLEWTDGINTENEHLHELPSALARVAVLTYIADTCDGAVFVDDPTEFGAEFHTWARKQVVSDDAPSTDDEGVYIT